VRITDGRKARKYSVIKNLGTGVHGFPVSLKENSASGTLQRGFRVRLFERPRSRQTRNFSRQSSSTYGFSFGPDAIQDYALLLADQKSSAANVKDSEFARLADTSKTASANRWRRVAEVAQKVHPESTSEGDDDESCRFMDITRTQEPEQNASFGI